jgi:WD40 repeat protein
VFVFVAGDWRAPRSASRIKRPGPLEAVLGGHTGSVSGALALADGRLVSWSNYGETLRLWSAEGAPGPVLEGHTNFVRGALALADGRLLSWSYDGTLRLWSAEGARGQYSKGIQTA